MTTTMISEILSALDDDGENQPSSSIQIKGDGGLFSYFPVTDMAAASMGCAGLMMADYAQLAASGPASPVVVDRRLASMWFDCSLRPHGWQVPPVWNAIAGDYRTQDGWIRLHTNAPAHRAAAVKVLNVAEDPEVVAQAVMGRTADELETAIVEVGGCAAMMRSAEEWSAHPQGQAVAAEPLIHWRTVGRGTTPNNPPQDPQRPLKSIRVLDLTRVLAGPVASRLLAGYGADVLRIDPPSWDEPGVVPEVTLGKRCAGLNLTDNKDRKTFEALLAKADMMLHGYRPDALIGLGYGSDALRTINPGLIDVSLDAYGWSGPWAGRRGFDSLVQMSSGIAARGMSESGAEKPVPLPVQALDHATGYLIAAAALKALTRKTRDGSVMSARLSLARTAKFLSDHRDGSRDAPLAAESASDLAPDIETTPWGRAQRLRFPVDIQGIPVAWPYPAGELRTATPVWL